GAKRRFPEWAGQLLFTFRAPALTPVQTPDPLPPDAWVPARLEQVFHPASAKTSEHRSRRPCREVAPPPYPTPISGTSLCGPLPTPEKPSPSPFHRSEFFGRFPDRRSPNAYTMHPRTKRPATLPDPSARCFQERTRFAS